MAQLTSYCLLLPASCLCCGTRTSRQARKRRDLAHITEASLALLDLIFPRHIIEYMTREASSRPQEDTANITPPAAAAAAAVMTPAAHQSLGQSLAAAGAKPAAATLCLGTLKSVGDFRHLTTHHEQVS